jgi:hypothetical protein
MKFGFEVAPEYSSDTKENRQPFLLTYQAITLDGC